MTNYPQANVIRQTPWGRIAGYLRRQREFRVEDILKAAKKGNLDQLLTSYYTINTDPTWKEKLKLCKDLQEAGFLQAEFTTDFDGKTPISMNGPARITIPGRDYLSRIEQNKLWRRFLGWVLAFALGLLSSFAVKWLDLLVDLYAKKHGLQ